MHYGNCGNVGVHSAVLFSRRFAVMQHYVMYIISFFPLIRHMFGHKIVEWVCVNGRSSATPWTGDPEVDSALRRHVFIS